MRRLGVGGLVVGGFLSWLITAPVLAQWPPWGSSTPSTPPSQPGQVCTTTCVPIGTPPAPNPSPSPTPPPATAPPPGPVGPPGGTSCLGGPAGTWTDIPNTGGYPIKVSSVLGGPDPDGRDGRTHPTGLSHFFIGVSGLGKGVWAPWWLDPHRNGPYNAALIPAGLAAVGGVRYLEVLPPGDGQCAIYEAGAPDWPAPGPSYVRIGISGKGGVDDGVSLGPGLPLYARFDADPRGVALAITVTRGTRP